MTHVSWFIWDLECHDDTHFHIWPKARSSSGQKRSNFETQNFLLRTYPLVHFCLRITKMSFVLTYSNDKNQIFWFKEVTSSQSPVFLGHCTAKMRILAWNFVHWLLLYSSILYIPFFLYIFKNLDFEKFICEKPNVNFWAFKFKMKNSFLIFENLHCRSCWKLAVSTQNRVTWRR